MTQLDAIRAFLRTIESGSVPVDRLSELAALLAQVWDDLPGSSAGGMEGFKIDTRKGSDIRIEKVRWEPPNLTFDIERHGAVVLGSKYGDVQTWTFDSSTGSINCEGSRRRLIHPTERRLDVQALANELSEKVLSGENDPRFIRRADGAVKVLVGKVIKADGIANATLTDRRRRFRPALEKNFQIAGWRKISSYVFKPNDDPH